MKRPSFHELKGLGFHLQAPGSIAPRGWIEPGAMDMLAKDAALITIPNAAVPAELLAYYDPRIIDIVTRPRKAREIASEVQKGDWTTPYAKFRVNELTGSTQPYSDFGDSRTSGVNYNWIPREQYVFQTLIQYGDFEEAASAAAKIQYSADKQRAAAYVIDVDANLFYLVGVQGRDIYGLLNEPNLYPAIAPLPSGGGGSVLWVDKSTQQIYEDVLYLFSDLVTQGHGWIDRDTPLTLAGNPTEELAYSDKIRAGRIVPDVSSFKQKWTSTTYGAIIYYPQAIATMRGIQ